MVEKAFYKLPLVFEPQPEVGYTVTCPLAPELITEGDTIAEAMVNVQDALVAILEAYEDLERSLPPAWRQLALNLESPFWIEAAVPA
jgi:antitoxin HicB